MTKNGTIIGEERVARDIGFKGRNKYVWVQCECGRKRWVSKHHLKARKNERCIKCRHKGDKNPRWRGGKRVTAEGYSSIKPTADDLKFVNAQKDGYVIEHRLVMARHIGRKLKANEIVHHVNENKNDNRIENLLLMTQAQHGCLNSYLATLWMNEHKESAYEIERKFIESGCVDETNHKRLRRKNLLLLQSR